MQKKRENVEFKKNIALTNMKRALKTAVISVVIIPICLLVAFLMKWDNDGMRLATIITLAIFEAIQLIMSIVIYCELKSDEFDRFKKVYLTYFAMFLVFVMFLSGCGLKTMGTEVLFVLSCLYMVFVPVFDRKEGIYMTVGQTAVALATIISLKAEINEIIDVCFIILVMAGVSIYQHMHEFKYQRLNIRLKKKTDSSEHDALTGLYNRRGMESRSSAVWSFCERNKIRVGVLALDIDFFKKYNDAFGHPAGDECLKKVARVLKESAQRGTDIITRTGGEEFLIFVQDTDDLQLVALGMKIRRLLESYEIEQAFTGVSKYVTVSIGAASLIPGYDNSFNSLYEEADKALYKAKASGRNCLAYNGKIYGKVQEKGIKFVI